MAFFDHDSLERAAKTAPELPRNEAHAGLVARNGEVGVEGEGSHDFGGGVTISGEVSWWRRMGYSAAVWVGWKGK